MTFFTLSKFPFMREIKCVFFSVEQSVLRCSFTAKHRCWAHALCIYTLEPNEHSFRTKSANKWAEEMAGAVDEPLQGVIMNLRRLNF